MRAYTINSTFDETKQTYISEKNLFIINNIKDRPHNFQLISSIRQEMNTEFEEKNKKESGNFKKIKDKKKFGVIYFIYSYLFSEEILHEIKIGWTEKGKDWYKRITKEIQPNSPGKLNILFAFEGSFQEEQFLHKIFDQYNTHHEWFKPDQKIRIFIETLKNSQKIKEIDIDGNIKITKKRLGLY